MNDVITISFDSKEELPLSIWEYLVKRRASFKCSKCGNKNKLVSHHIVSRANEGKNTLDNGACFCTHCHPRPRLHNKDYYYQQQKQKFIKYILMVEPNRSNLSELSVQELEKIFYSFPEKEIIRRLMGIELP